MTNQAFVDKYYPYAERINKEYNLKFSPYFWLGQWALESANGTNKWTTEGNNVSASNVTNGAKTPVNRSGSQQNYFSSMEEWYNHLVNKIFNLGGNSTYSRAGFKSAKTIDEASRAVVAGGYVGPSDPNKNIYAQGITNKAKELMNTTTPPKGSFKFDDTIEKNNNSSNNASTTDNNISVEQSEEDSSFNTFKELEKYLTIKNIFFYFIGLTLALVIIRYLNDKKGSEKK